MRRHPVSIAFLLTLTWAMPLFAQTVATLDLPKDRPLPIASDKAHPLQIAGGDLLDVDVFDTAELSRKLRVSEKGAISLPVGGDLFVGGLTAVEAGHAIEVRFRQDDILRDPHVSVTVLEYATQGVTVLGEVKNPGVYPLLGTHGVLDLISAAGGQTTNAGNTVTVTHRADPIHSVIANVQNRPGRVGALGVDVLPGDTIVVSHAGIVYVVGDVGKPGGFLIESNDQLSVLQAIALAQGTNRTAALDHAKIIRKTDSGREELPVPLKKIVANKGPDEMLFDGDILFVPTSGAKTALRDIEAILPQAAAASIYHVP